MYTCTSNRYIYIYIFKYIFTCKYLHILIYVDIFLTIMYKILYRSDQCLESDSINKAAMQVWKKGCNITRSCDNICSQYISICVVFHPDSLSMRSQRYGVLYLNLDNLTRVAFAILPIESTRQGKYEKPLQKRKASQLCNY